MENQGVFGLVSRLCEIFLDSKGTKESSSSRTLHLKKLRLTAYGILLKPSETAFSDNPHESFVSAFSAYIQNGIEQVESNAEEFDKCVEHLWSEISEKPYLASVVYFLSKLHDENFSLGGEFQDICGRDGLYSDMGYSPLLPKQYQMYHPSLFTLPKLEDCAGRESTFMCSTSVSGLLPKPSMLLPPIGLELNFSSRKEEQQWKGLVNLPKSFLHNPKVAGDDCNNLIEDEGYVSHGATPLGASPAGWCGMPWDVIEMLDKCCAEKGKYRTWEALGEASPARELPTLMEAGTKALHCQLKIQECLIFTLEPSLWSPPKNPTSWPSFFQQIMYLVIGVESESFSFNKKLDAFELLSGTWVEGLSHEALALYSNDFLMMGTCFRRLSSLLEPPPCQDAIGVVQLAIQRSLKTYLNLYSGACMVIMQNLLKQSLLSFTLVKSKVKIFHSQIIGLARAFGKWGSGNTIPNGVGALGHLYRHSSGAQRKELVYLLRYILNSACRAYFNLLERWVYNGEVVDEGDFFVATRMEYISHRSRRYWTRTFSVNSALLPEFLCGFETLLLRCGKSVHFLKLCDPKNAVLEDRLNLKRLNSEDTTVQDKDVEEPKICLSQSEIVNVVTDLDSTNQHNADDPLHDSHDVSAEEVVATAEKIDAEVPSDDTVLSKVNEPQKDVSKDEEKLPPAPHSSEEEIRIQAVREMIIEEYTKSSVALDKRYMRADWRKRRLLLRTQKKLPSKSPLMQPVSSQCDSQIPLPSVPIKPSAPENTKEALCENNLENSITSERMTETEIDRKDDNLVDILPLETSGDDIVDEPVISEEDNQSKEICGKEGENSCGKSEKPRDAPSEIVSVDCFEVSNHEKVLVPTDSTEMSEVEELHRGQDSVKSETIAVSEGSIAGKDVEFVAESVMKTERCAENDDLFSNLISFPPASALISPRRTPLKKVDGLFSFPQTPEVSAKDELIEADEAEQLDWPYRPVLVSLVNHSRKVDAALLRWLLVDKGLISHLHSIRSYFFLLDGEFGRRLSEDLFSAMRIKPGKKPSVECLNTVTLNGILSHALASSTHAVSDPNASLLSMTLRVFPAQASAFEQIGSIQMVYDAPWPVNVVLTDEALSKYSRVLDLLLRLKHASWALEDVFMHMRTIDPCKGNKEVFSGGWKSPSEAFQHSPQFRTLHIYRHQMLNLIRSVQSYITAEVLQASGKKLEEAIAHASCLDEFYSEHVSYVKRILFECLLNKRSETISTILNDILKLIVKFHWSLCSRPWTISHDQGNGECYNLIHPNFSVLTRIHSAFKDMTDFLLKYAWRLANHGYQAHLSTLLLMVNANNYYKPENGCDGSGKDGSESSGPPG